MAGGFQSIIPQLRLGGTTPTQGGFGTPLGVFLVRGPGGVSTPVTPGGFGIIPFVRISAKSGGNKFRHTLEDYEEYDIPWPAIWEKQDVEDFEFIMMAVAAIEDSYEIGGEIFEKTKPRTDS